jgi:glycosyltransferase involved in cell wall biosynthesis
LCTVGLLASVALLIARSRNKFDILHAHIGNPFSAAAIVGARLARRPSLVKVAASGGWSDFLKMRTRTYGRAGPLLLPGLLLSDRFVVLNGESESELVARVGSKRVRRIPNGLAPTTVRWRADNTLGYVFAAGRLDRQKGFDLLIQACADDGPELVIAGEGPDAAPLAALARRVGTRLRLLGQIDHAELPRWLLAASLVVAPSRAEGMSNVLLEAMAVGCPILASRVPGNVDVIEHGVSGWLVPTEDPGALRAAIDRLLLDRSLAQELACSAAARAEREFSIDAVANQYAWLYSELLEH